MFFDGAVAHHREHRKLAAFDTTSVYNKKHMPETFSDPDSLLAGTASPSPPGASASIDTPSYSAFGPCIGVWLRDLVISLAISAFIIIFLYQPVKVEGTSMMPSLRTRSASSSTNLCIGLEPIERGDIVVFRYPRDPSKSYIKRVIGWRATRFASTAVRCM